MSNQTVGDLYAMIIDHVVDMSRHDFEDHGSDHDTLRQLKALWQDKLTSTGVAVFPWAPDEPPRPQTAPSDPTIKTEPYTIAGSNDAAGTSQTKMSSMVEEAASAATSKIPSTEGLNWMTEEEKSHIKQLWNQGPNTAAALRTAQQIKALTETEGAGKLSGAAADTQKNIAPAAPNNTNNTLNNTSDSANKTQFYLNATQASNPATNNKALTNQIDRIVAQKVQEKQLKRPRPSDEKEQPGSAFTQRQRSDQYYGQYDGADASDEDAINSDLDDSEVDDPDDNEDGDSLTGQNIILCQYEKVARVKNKWKCALKDGIIGINGKDYVFLKGSGEFEW